MPIFSYMQISCDDIKFEKSLRLGIKGMVIMMWLCYHVHSCSEDLLSACQCSSYNTPAECIISLKCSAERFIQRNLKCTDAT